jgi:hypothetical protein
MRQMQEKIQQQEEAIEKLRGCPETFAHRPLEIKPPPGGNETQGDHRERVGSASDVYD